MTFVFMFLNVSCREFTKIFGTAYLDKRHNVFSHKKKLDYVENIPYFSVSEHGNKSIIIMHLHLRPRCQKCSWPNVQNTTLSAERIRKTKA